MLKSTLWLLLALYFTLGSCSSENINPNKSSEATLDSLLIKGINESQKLNFDLAQDALDELLHKAETNNSTKHLILGNLNFGNLYNYYGLHDEALRYFILALETSKETGNDDYLNSIYNNIGIIYSANQANDEAHKYFEKALAISKEQGQEPRIGMNLINMGINYTALNNNEAALAFFNEALGVFENLNDSNRIGAVRNSIGTIHFNEADFNAAMRQYEIAYKSSSTVIEPWFRWEYALNIGKSFLALGNLDSAQTYTSEALAGFSKGNNKNLEIEANKIQSEIYLQQDLHILAYSYIRNIIAIQDSVLSEKTSDWVSQKKLSYEFGKKEKELELIATNAARKQTLTILIGFSGAVVAILLGIMAWSRLRRLRQANLLLEKEQSLSTLRLETNRISQEKQAKEYASQEIVNRLEREKLQQEIDFKNRALVGKAMNVANQNEHFNSLQNILARAVENQEGQEKAIQEALHIIKSHESVENEWESFKIHFEEVHPNFFAQLARHNNLLNSGDHRMCAYIILDLSPKEIAQLLNISPSSVRKRRQRLREKLNLTADINLTDWLKTTFLPI